MNRIFYLIPTIYLALIVILISNYVINAKKATFYWGNIAVTVSTPNQESQKKLKETGLNTTPVTTSKVKISLPYASFSFNTHVDIFNNSDLGRANLSKISALTSGDGFILSFADKAFVSFQTKELVPEEIAIVVRSNIGSDIQIPMLIDWNIKTSFESNTLRFSSFNNSGVLRASYQGNISQSKNHWVLSTKNNYASFYFSDGNQSQSKQITSIPKISPNTTEDAELVIQQYLDKMYQGLLKDRFDSSLGAWLQPEGFSSFSEKALIVSYIESIKRGDLFKNKIKLDKAAIFNRGGLSWRSANFYKNGQSLFETFGEYVTTSKDYALEEIKKNHIDFIQDLDFWDSISFWDNSISWQTFMNFITKTDAINVSSENSTLLLYQAMHSTIEDFTSYITLNQAALEQNILNNIVVANDGYMLLDSVGNINTFFSIMAGKYLSQHSSKESIRLLGYRMLITALSLADNNGILPRMYLTKNTGLVSLGFIVPEDIYFILTNDAKKMNIGQIHFIPEQEVYIFSLSDIVFNQNTDEIEVSIYSESKEISQFIYIWPIKRARSIQGFNAYWTGSQFPSNFTQGIHYDIQDEILTIKTLNRNNPEKIKLTF